MVESNFGADQVQCIPLIKDVAAESCFEVGVSLRAPGEPGHYFVALQMRTDCVSFGEKVWCDFIVEDPSNQGLLDMLDMKKPVALAEQPIAQEYPSYANMPPPMPVWQSIANPMRSSQWLPDQ